MKISVVTTLYHSKPYVKEFYSRILKVINEINCDYEIIFVNDGSPDDSLEEVLELHRENENIIVVELSKNFGQHKAMMTGMKYATGDYVLIIDVDLEEKPELLKQYWEEINNNESDVVYGVIQNKYCGIIKKHTSKIFYRLLNYMSNEDMPVDISFSRLMKKEYVKSLLKFTEREMYIGGLWHIAGYKQTPVFIEKTYKGVSSYTFKKKMDMLINAVTAFSNKPLVMIFNLGMFISGVSIFYATFLIIKKLFFGIAMSGWTSIMVTMWFLFGITILCVGIVAIYLSKIFIEVKRRPYTIVKQIYRKNKNRGN